MHPIYALSVFVFCHNPKKNYIINTNNAKTPTKFCSGPNLEALAKENQYFKVENGLELMKMITFCLSSTFCNIELICSWVLMTTFCWVLIACRSEITLISSLVLLLMQTCVLFSACSNLFYYFVSFHSFSS